MDQLILFNYDTLDAETRIVVQQRTTEIKDLVRATAENIMRVGEKLLEVQIKLGNGQFDAWLKGEFDWSRRTAYNFIGVYKEFNGRANFAQIEIATSALYLLSAPSTPESAREEIMQRAEAGEPITHTTAKAVVEAHKAAEEETKPKQTTMTPPPPARPAPTLAPLPPMNEPEEDWLPEAEEENRPEIEEVESKTVTSPDLPQVDAPTAPTPAAAPPPPPPPPAPKAAPAPDFHLHVTFKFTGLCLLTLTQVGKAEPLANKAVDVTDLLAHLEEILRQKELLK